MQTSGVVLGQLLMGQQPVFLSGIQNMHHEQWTLWKGWHQSTSVHAARIADDRLPEPPSSFLRQIQSPTEARLHGQRHYRPAQLCSSLAPGCSQHEVGVLEAGDTSALAHVADSVSEQVRVSAIPSD